MNELFQHLKRSCRIVVVAVALFALAVSSLGTAQRLFDGFGASDGSNDSLCEEMARLIQGPPAPEELPENMVPGSKPDVEQPAFIQASQILKSDSGESRFRVHLDCVDAIETSGSDGGCKSDLKTSVCRVSTVVGTQFTLVGAKPSGTS